MSDPTNKQSCIPCGEDVQVAEGEWWCPQCGQASFGGEPAEAPAAGPALAGDGHHDDAPAIQASVEPEGEEKPEEPAP